MLVPRAGMRVSNDEDHIQLVEFEGSLALHVRAFHFVEKVLNGVPVSHIELVLSVD